MIAIQEQYQLVENMMSEGAIKCRKIQECKENPLYKELLITYNTFSGDEKDLRLYLQIVDISRINERIVEDGYLYLDFCYISETLLSRHINDLKVKSISAQFAYFEKEVRLSSIEMDGFLNFTGAVFESNAIFENLRFSEKRIDFSLAHFKTETYFLNSNFNGDLDFSQAIVHKAGFVKCTIKKSLIFEMASAETLSFFLCDFLGEGLAKLKMFSCRAKNVMFQICNICSDQHYDLGTVEKYEFVDCVIERNIEFMKKSDELNTGMLAFDDKTECIGRIKSEWGVIKEAIDKYEYSGKLYSVGPDFTQTFPEAESKVKLKTFTSKCHTLTVFKENYHSIGNYDWEDSAYVEFKRNERQKLKYDAIDNKKNRVKNRVKVCLSKLIDLIGCYGTDPTRVALSMFVVFALFSGLFTLCFLNEIMAGGSKEIQWWSGIYFSGITFLTIGYGTVTPLGMISSALAVIEGFMGMFLMSYFSVAVVRKTLR